MVKCTDNGGFEDLLTENHNYVMIERGVNGFLVETDKGDLRWFGSMKFEVVL
jgi:hypothetical protein